MGAEGLLAGIIMLILCVDPEAQSVAQVVLLLYAAGRWAVQYLLNPS